MATATKKDLSHRLIKTVPFLKAWARQPNESAGNLANALGMWVDLVYKQIIPEFIGLYQAAVQQQDFPSNILIYYNQHGSNAPENILTEQEVQALRPVYDRDRTPVQNWP
jgi:hypothetical protein